MFSLLFSSIPLPKLKKIPTLAKIYQFLIELPVYALLKGVEGIVPEISFGKLIDNYPKNKLTDNSRTIGLKCKKRKQLEERSP